MGCDIHPVVQVRVDGHWQTVPSNEPSYEGGGDKWEAWRKWRDEHPAGILGWRNYDVFAVLGNVRNGYGFARTITGEPLPFIQENRGLPKDDFEMNDGDHMGEWMGDHSFGWVSLGELEFYNWTYRRMCRGVIPAAEYEKWDRSKGAPKSYSGWVSGSKIVVVPEEQYRSTRSMVATGTMSTISGKVLPELVAMEGKDVYVDVSWGETVEQSVGKFHSVVVPWLRSLVPEGGTAEDVRIVFGFDS
jgi:hypothetical protein